MKWGSVNTDISLFLFFFQIESVVPGALLINIVQRFGLTAAINKHSSAKAGNDFFYYKTNKKKKKKAKTFSFFFYFQQLSMFS